MAVARVWKNYGNANITLVAKRKQMIACERNMEDEIKRG